MPGRNINSILGSPDDLKFRSCLTLFAATAPEEPLFAAALEKFFASERDALTISLLHQFGDVYSIFAETKDHHA